MLVNLSLNSFVNWDLCLGMGNFVRAWCWE